MIITYVCDKCAGRNCIVSREASEKGVPAFCCVSGRPNAGNWRVAGKISEERKGADHAE